ncbi:major facilitator superfamily domain-containing protein [Lasiosphaeria miniovina]|uniref:Major facilitator superfamily domain-containing protein n=1 Tax=Lasiosphaeria miniovina TaxID=1954250 RepID=A0AA40DV91_9PEZI|nr:major facilitator superfamily domain-containing protein [Lasiosphaeria miniovina]KAK0716855.1 major facilitator superfamily domain-containing protein [Lasiosphaeria miniovina]
MNTVADDAKNLDAHDPGHPEPTTPIKFQPTARFWAIIATLCAIGLLSSLENSVVTTALPRIVTELGLGEDYIWVTNSFFLTAWVPLSFPPAVQPLIGQLANLFGRRWVTMVIVACFTLGSGIAGGATNEAMLIAGRSIQGVGAGGINILVDIIVSDLVPLCERGNYIAVVLLVYTIGISLGPWVGGAIIDSTTWRWVFYINLPVGGVALVMIFLFLHVKHDRTQSVGQKLLRIDYIGNAVLVASTVSVLYALTYGGVRLPWSSGQVIAPLVVGLVGFVLFAWYESTYVGEPVVPPELFRNRTSGVIFVATFLNSALLYWGIFFLPVYFQAVLGSSAARAGVQILPSVLFAIPGAIVAVLLLSRYGRYKPIHIVAFAVSTLGLGLFTLFDAGTSMAEWVIFQAIGATGSGLVLNTLLPAVQAQVEERHQAATTSAWSFTRSFGSIWGVAIPAAIFNNRFVHLLAEADIDPAVRQLFDGNNHGYENGHADFIWAIQPPEDRDKIIGVYSEALKLIWQVGIAFAGTNLLITFLEKEIPLRTELETEFGMAEFKEEANRTTKAV